MRLLQGVSILCVGFLEGLKQEGDGKKKKNSVINWFDFVFEQYFGEQSQSRIGRLIQQKIAGLYFRDAAINILNILIFFEKLPCGKIIEGQTNYLFMY